MGLLFERKGPGADYERIVVVHDEAIGLKAVIAIHSTRRGPAFGGIRRLRYAQENAAVSDALALAEAMSHKCALAGLRAGGAKTVVLRPAAGPEPDWAACYRALGRAVDSLGGRYVCGPDVGTGGTELDWVRHETDWVNPAPNDAGAATAAGVLAGIRAVFDTLGIETKSSASVAIQGLGAVGLGVARGLLADGVRVLGADVRASACETAQALGVEIVHPMEILGTPCDVLSPCALGGVLDPPTVAALRCRAVCGSANNQLSGPDAARMLLRRGIMHAPDVIVSAGAVIEGVLTLESGTGFEVRARVRQKVDSLYGITRRVLDEARRQDQPPTELAAGLARSAVKAGA